MSGLNNKTILIPVVLSAIVVIAGIFAFMPIEKVTTVHGTLPTSTTLTTETQGIDQFAQFRVNFTNNYKQKITLIPASSGTITGFATLTAEPNQVVNRTVAPIPVEQQFQCGLSTTNSEKLGINATQGNSTSLALSAVLSANEGIVVEAVNSTNMVPGVCIITLILDSSTG
ncbi:MAG: hypothetical protein HYS75_03660 [Nitrosopumilales archaeon]|nr:hypothetical protein [Nitrosopumilales archaeon]